MVKTTKFEMCSKRSTVLHDMCRNSAQFTFSVLTIIRYGMRFDCKRKNFYVIHIICSIFVADMTAANFSRLLIVDII